MSSKCYRKCILCLNYVRSKKKLTTHRDCTEEQVLITYFFRKLIWTPLGQEDFAKFLQIGNPSQWAALCHICEGRVKQALHLHREIERMLGEINEIRQRIFDENFYDSDNEEEISDWEVPGGKDVFANLRRRLLDDFKESRQRKKFFSGSVVLDYRMEQSPPTYSKFIIKREFIPEEDGRSEDGYSDSMQEAVESFFGDESALSDPLLGASNFETGEEGDNSNLYGEEDDSLVQGSSDASNLWANTSRQSFTGAPPSKRRRKKHSVVTEDIPKNPPVLQKECPVCGRRFNTAATMRRHYRESHLKEKHFACDCGKTFARKEYLVTHIELRHPELLPDGTTREGNQCACLFCSSKFLTSRALHTHMRSVHKEAYLSYLEDKRSKVKNEGLAEDVVQESLGGSSCVCDECGISCATANYLASHKMFAHGVDVKNNLRNEMRTCPLCAKVFRTSAIMRRHVNESHQNRKDYECSACGKTFARREYLTKHVEMKHFFDRDVILKQCFIPANRPEGAPPGEVESAVQQEHFPSEPNSEQVGDDGVPRVEYIYVAD